MGKYDTYCLDSDILSIYPNISEFDTKTPIYQFTRWQDNESDNPIYQQLSHEHWVCYNTGHAESLYVNGKDWGDPGKGIPDLVGNQPSQDIYKWIYEGRGDFVVVHIPDRLGDPNNYLMEIGQDWNDLVNRTIVRASRFFDSRVNANIERKQFKNAEGEYDYIVIRTTALIVCKFLMMGYDLDSPSLLAFEEEINFNIDLINSGQTKLSHQITPDASKGEVTIIKQATQAGLNLVDTRGSYTGVYDNIKIVCTTSGKIGVGKFDVYIGNATDGIKSYQSLKDQVVTGLYQTIGNGLQVRFQGQSLISTMQVNDEWQIECWGKGEEYSDLGYKSIISTKITRGGTGAYR